MLKAQFILQRAVHSQIEAIGEGFFAVAGASAVLGSKLTAAELRLVLCGLTRVDLSELRPLTQYRGGYSAAHAVVRWFWEVVLALSQEDQLRFLRFYSAAEATPAQGFAQLLPGRPPLTIASMERGSGPVANLPVSRSCRCLIVAVLLEFWADQRDNPTRRAGAGAHHHRRLRTRASASWTCQCTGARGS